MTKKPTNKKAKKLKSGSSKPDPEFRELVKKITHEEIEKLDKKDSGISKRASKQDLLISLLERPDGATIDDLVAAIGWKKHSIRGVISGTLKKRLGLKVTSDQEERERVYRIIAGGSSI